MSGSSGVVRKVFDIGPKAVTSNSNYDGSGSPTTQWVSGVLATEWISDLSQGVTDNDRVGFSIAAESIDFALNVVPDPAATGHSTLRAIMFADNECDGALPLTAELLGNSQQSDTSIATGWILSHLQPAYFGRFHVMMDEYFSWATNTGSAFTLGNATHPFVHRRHFDLKDHKIVWDMSDASAITNARKGHIFLFFYYQTVTTSTGGLPTLVTTNPPSIQYSMRMRYRDA